MSLLADLLSKIKQSHTVREVPPNLKSIVERSSRYSAQKKKIVMLSVILVGFVLSGIMFVKYLASIKGDDTSNFSESLPSVEINTDAKQPQDIASLYTTDEKKQQLTAEAGKSGSAPTENRPDTHEAHGTAIQTKVTAPEAPPSKPEKAVEAVSVMIPVTAAEAESDTDLPEPAVPDKKNQETQKYNSDKDLHLYLAKEMEMKNNHAGALEEYKKALEKDSKDISIMNNIAYLYLQSGLIHDSITYSRMALDVNNNYVPAIINLSIALANTENLSEAEVNLEKALRLEPENQSAILNMGILKERRKEYLGALEHFAKLAALGNVKGYLGLARIYETAGKVDEALKFYRSAYSLDSADEPSRSLARQRIVILSNMGQR